MITKITTGDYSPSLDRLNNLLRQFKEGTISLDNVWDLMQFYYTTTVPIACLEDQLKQY